MFPSIETLWWFLALSVVEAFCVIVFLASFAEIWQKADEMRKTPTAGEDHQEVWMIKFWEHQRMSLVWCGAIIILLVNQTIGLYHSFPTGKIGGGVWVRGAAVILFASIIWTVNNGVLKAFKAQRPVTH